MIDPGWTTIRTMVNVAAEGVGVPADGAFVQPLEPNDVDVLVSFSGCTFSGAPNSASVWIWSWHSDNVVSIKDKLAEVIIAGSESGVMMPVIVRPGPAKIAVTLSSFNGGAVPKMSGTIRLRRLHINETLKSK